MLYAYNAASQTVLTGAPVIFSTVGVETGCTAVLNSGSVRINRSGLYIVHVNLDAATSGTSGNLKFQLTQNGSAVAGVSMSANSASATDLENLAMTAIVRVAPNCCVNTSNIPTTLAVICSGVGATISNAAITVSKIG